MASWRRGAEPEELSLPQRAIQAAGPLGVAKLQHSLRPGLQGHLHLRHELRRISTRCADMPASGERDKRSIWKNQELFDFALCRTTCNHPLFTGGIMRDEELFKTKSTYILQKRRKRQQKTVDPRENSVSYLVVQVLERHVRSFYRTPYFCQMRPFSVLFTVVTDYSAYWSRSWYFILHVTKAYSAITAYSGLCNH